MTGYRSGVPDNWFVDPVNLGVPGVRRPFAAVKSQIVNPQGRIEPSPASRPACRPRGPGVRRAHETRAPVLATAGGVEVRTADAVVSLVPGAAVYVGREDRIEVSGAGAVFVAQPGRA
jgi:hypothetical protein